MTKTRFTAADVRAMVRDLRASVHGLRVVNVYDLDSKTYLFKLASPGQEKAVLLLESGVRFHTTRFTHTKSDMPSGFSMKLRKHIRTKRLEDVRQVGMDRVVDFKFGSGETANHIILELYAQGNLILTDHKYEILDLLRTHTYDGQRDEGDVRVAVRQIYPMDLATTQEGTPTASVVTALSTAAEGVGGEKNEGAAAAAAVVVSEMSMDAEVAFSNGMPTEVAMQRMGDWLQRAAVLAAEPPPAPATEVEAADGGSGGNRKKGKGGGGSRKAKKATLKQALMQKGSGVSVYGPSVLEHCVLGAGLRPNAKLSAVGALSAATPAAVSGTSSGDTSTAIPAANTTAAEDSHAKALVAEPCCRRGGFSEDEIRRLVIALAGADATVQQLDRPGQQGYILCKPLGGKGAASAATAGGDGGVAHGARADFGGDGKEDMPKQGEGGKQKAVTAAGGEEEGDDSVVYEEYLPQLLAQHEGAQVHTFPSFDQAVDAFFGRIVEQKLKQVAVAADAAVEKKVALIRQDQEKRARALEERQETMLRHAQLAEASADEVEKALMVVRSALANGMNWQDLDELVKTETANGNPIASLIHELRLDRNKVVLLLPTADGDEQLVEVEVMLSAHANARVMYENKKGAREKELKTLKAAEKVLKIAEQQAQKALQRQQHKRSLQVARKTYWFEKFNWFITSENYLVLNGRDAQQNEVVVKKYLRQGDIYVHADLHGASSCVVRNKDPSGKRPVSPLALEEAGCMTVCRSSAWGAKMVTSAWWVYADQVSKTAPTGEYLVTGSFMIRGRKHFLPPRSLEMGFALLFRVEDSCLAAHAGERRERIAGDDGGGGERKGLLGAEYGFGGVDSGDDVDSAKRGVRFDAPMGLDEKRTGLDDAADGEAADSRRAAALAALAGVGVGQGSSSSVRGRADGGSKGRGGEGGGGSWAGFGGDGAGGADAPKKRLSAKERKLARKGGGNKGKTPSKQNETADASTADADGSTAAVSDGGGGVGNGDNKGRAQKNGKVGDGVDPAAANGSGSMPRGKRGKLKRMKKYAEQDDEDRKLAMEALGTLAPEGDGAPVSRRVAGRGRSREGDAAAAAAAMATAEAAISKNELKMEAERAVALSALDGDVRARLEGLVQPNELDAFEIRALGKFDKADAVDILGRFAEADLRKVRNRSGFLAGIMRKHGSASNPAAAPTPTPFTAQPSLQVDGLPPPPAQVQAQAMMATVVGSKVIAAGATATVPPPVPPTVGDAAAAVADVRASDATAETTGAEAAAATSTATGGNNPAAGGAQDDSIGAEGKEKEGEKDDDDVVVDVGQGDLTDTAAVEREKGEGDEGVQDHVVEQVIGAAEAAAEAAASARQEDKEKQYQEEETGSLGNAEGGPGTGDAGEGEDGEESLSRRGRKRREEEEVRKLLEEEGGEHFDGDGEAAAAAAAAAASELDRLTGKPRDEDVLLYAVPVCGPYISLRDYRYKVKLTPGKQKRGKASKQAIEMFSRVKDCPTTHKSLMKGVTDNDCVQAMIGDVKVSVAGLAQATQAKKKANKQQAQKDPGKSAKQQQPKSKRGKGK